MPVPVFKSINLLTSIKDLAFASFNWLLAAGFTQIKYLLPLSNPSRTVDPDNASYTISSPVTKGKFVWNDTNWSIWPIPTSCPLKSTKTLSTLNEKEGKPWVATYMDSFTLFLVTYAFWILEIIVWFPNSIKLLLEVALLITLLISQFLSVVIPVVLDNCTVLLSITVTTAVVVIVFVPLARISTESPVLRLLLSNLSEIETVEPVISATSYLVAIL